MNKKIEHRTQDVQQKTYEAPQMEIIEMEIEGPILQMSGENGGQQPW